MSNISQHILRNALYSIIFGILFFSFLVILIVRMKSANKLGCFLVETLCGIKSVIHAYIMTLYCNLNAIDVDYLSTFSNIVSVSKLLEVSTTILIAAITALLLQLCRKKNCN